MNRIGLVLLCVGILAGCRGPGEVVDPFLGRTTIEPPRTGAVRGLRPEPYYNPGRSVATVSNPLPAVNPAISRVAVSPSAVASPVPAAMTTPARIVTTPPPLWISDRPRKVRTNELARSPAVAPAVTLPPAVVCVPRPAPSPVVCAPVPAVVCVPQTNLFAAPPPQPTGQVCVPLARTINIADLPEPSARTAAAGDAAAR